VWNHSSLTVGSVEEVDWKYLRKRAGGFPEDDSKWTISKLDTYLPATIEKPDNFFDEKDKDGQPNVLGLVEGVTMDSVSRQKRFYRRTPFQVGTSGLHGCTVVTLTSNRAVWMVSSPFPMHIQLG
jgi:hypothetical protein